MQKKLQFKTMLLILALFLTNLASGAGFPFEYIFKSGDPSTKVNFVFMGDGYKANQMDKFISDVTSTTNGMFSQEPFKSLKGKFNVIAIKVPSNAEGAANDPNKLIDNYFGSTFNYGGIQRLLVATKSNKVSSVLNSTFPEYDEGIIIVNDSRYGGSGGQWAALSTHSSAVELCAHELGHSYAKLADEYWYRAQEKANQTADNNTNTNRWRSFIGKGGVGIYQYESPGSNYYRPHQNCKMRYLSRDFCPVCKNEITKKTNSLAGSGGGGEEGAVPSIPTNFKSYDVKSTSFGISWSPVTGATSYDIQVWNGSAWVNKGSTSKNNSTLSGYSAGSSQYVRVRATNTKGSSAWTRYITVTLSSTSVGASAPAAPTNLKSYNVKSNAFGIYWSKVSGATSYNIQVWDGNAWIDKGSTEQYYYNVSGFSTGSTQHARVRATNSNGSSDWTSFISVKLSSRRYSPATKAAISAAHENNENDVFVYPSPSSNIIHVAGLGNTITEINIYNLSGMLVKTLNKDSSQSINVSDLKAGYYLLSAKNKDGELIMTKFIKE